MTELLNYLKAHRKAGPIAVVIDSQTRFARDVIAHLHLRDALKKAGGILVSPSQSFGDTSHDRLVETVLAAGAQFQREVNAEQTRDRMRGRVLNGYWPFQAPVGYRHVNEKGHKGKLLVRKEPEASIVCEALEGFASGRFESQAEVKRFLDDQTAFPKDGYGEVRFQQVTDILTRIIYAGYTEMPEWNLPLRKGQHD